MSFAYRGITHCAECGNTLEMHEIYLCKHCQEKEDARKAEKAFQEVVARQVKIELAKRDNKIETIKLSRVNDEDNIKEFSGYWENDVFYILPI